MRAFSCCLRNTERTKCHEAATTWSLCAILLYVYMCVSFSSFSCLVYNSFVLFFSFAHTRTCVNKYLWICVNTKNVLSTYQYNINVSIYSYNYFSTISVQAQFKKVLNYTFCCLPHIIIAVITGIVFRNGNSPLMILVRYLQKGLKTY